MTSNNNILRVRDENKDNGNKRIDPKDHIIANQAIEIQNQRAEIGNLRVENEGLREEVRRLNKKVDDLVKELTFIRGKRYRRDETTSSEDSNDASSPQQKKVRIDELTK